MPQKRSARRSMDVTGRRKPLTIYQFREWAASNLQSEMFLTDEDHSLGIVLLEQAYIMGLRDAGLEDAAFAEKLAKVGK